MQGQLTEQISTVPPTNAYIKLNLNLPDRTVTLSLVIHKLRGRFNQFNFLRQNPLLSSRLISFVKPSI